MSHSKYAQDRRDLVPSDKSEAQHDDYLLDEALRDGFPASDLPALDVDPQPRPNHRVHPVRSATSRTSRADRQA